MTNAISGFRKGDGFFLNRCDLANILYQHTQNLGLKSSSVRESQNTSRQTRGPAWWSTTRRCRLIV